MVKTHEINLYTTAFNQFTNSSFIVLENTDISVGDFVLFRQVETVDGETNDTGLFVMTRVKEVIRNYGLKDNFSILIVDKIY